MRSVSPIELNLLIRDIPDYPEQGVIFKDITPLLTNPEAFNYVVDQLVDEFHDKGITKVLCPEARGFIVGAPLALKLNAGFIPARKPGKLPGSVYTVEYELEYGTDRLEIKSDALSVGDNVLIVDDVLATGGTASAMVDMCLAHDAHVTGFACLLDLTFLGGSDLLKKKYAISPYSLLD